MSRESFLPLALGVCVTRTLRHTSAHAAARSSRWAQHIPVHRHPGFPLPLDSRSEPLGSHSRFASPRCRASHSCSLPRQKLLAISSLCNCRRNAQQRSGHILKSVDRRQTDLTSTIDRLLLQICRAHESFYQRVSGPSIPPSSWTPEGCASLCCCLCTGGHICLQVARK